MMHPADQAIDAFLARRRVKSALLMLSSWLVLIFGAWMLTFAIQGEAMGMAMAFVSLTLAEMGIWLILDLDVQHFPEHFDPEEDDHHD